MADHVHEATPARVESLQRRLDVGGGGFAHLLGTLRRGWHLTQARAHRVPDRAASLVGWPPPLPRRTRGRPHRPDPDPQGARGPARRRRPMVMPSAGRRCAGGRQHALADRSQGSSGRRPCRRSSPTSRSAAPRTSAASASAADRTAAAGLDMTDLLDRKLLFVTGQGRRRQDHDRGLARAPRRPAGQADARRRGRRQGQPGRLLRDRPHGVQAEREVSAGPVGHVDGHRGVAQGVPEPPAQDPAGRPDRPAGTHVRLRGQRRARA